jgi:Cu2+-exporting ATPase
MIDRCEARLGSPTFCGFDYDVVPAARDTSIIAFRHGEKHALLEVRQSLRSDAAEAVQTLKAMKLDVRILSGDHTDAVEPVAKALGITEWLGGVKPAGKIAALEALSHDGHCVLMIGDGLNDAPALAAAHASLSPISAVDLAQAQADAVFLGERLQPAWEAIAASRHAHRLMHQNLWLAIVYNVFAVPVAMLGFVTPLIAAAAMSGSSLLVTLNALRARRQTADWRNPQGGRP